MSMKKSETVTHKSIRYMIQSPIKVVKTDNK